VSDQKGCGHGKSFKVPCLECGLLWHRDLLAISEQNAQRHRAAIAKLEMERETKA
jgi:hypothetical protein